MYFDSHVHFERDATPEAVRAILDRAAASGVDGMLAVGASDGMNAGAEHAAGLDPCCVALSIGYDRDQASRFGDAAGIAAAVAALADRVGVLRGQGLNVCAVGEIGLDYHYSPETSALQRTLFREQLAMARGHGGLPVVVHSRDADEDTVAELETHVRAWIGRPGGIGVLHCFTGGAGFAERLLALGLHISFSGILTFRNADALRDVARIVPLDRLLIETDSPYLAPVPHRGKPNEPAYVVHVAEALAAVRGLPVEEIAAITASNARRLFGLA